MRMSSSNGRPSTGQKEDGVKRFEDRRVIVTGAGSGIGRAVTDRFAREGAIVRGFDLTAGRSDAGVPTVSVDVQERAQVAAAMDDFTAEFGGVDVLVTCAGVYAAANALEATDEEFDLLFGVNVRGTFIAAQEAARRMPAVPGGCIVTVASVAARLSTPENVLYGASKGAVEALTRGLAVSLAPKRIRVNGVAPGPVATPQGEAAMTDPEYRRRMLGRQLIEEPARPEDIAAAIAFLASEDARFVDGEMLSVDAGIQAVR